MPVPSPCKRSFKGGGGTLLSQVNEVSPALIVDASAAFQDLVALQHAMPNVGGDAGALQALS
jgi:hypothetical protein